MIPHLEPITTPVRELNPRIMELITADRLLTAEEWAELEKAEKETEA